MKRAITVHGFGDSSVLKVQEQRDGPVLSSGQVRLEMLCAGVNPVDTYIRGGSYGVLPALPYTPGFDGCGKILEIGPQVQRPDLHVGQRVWCYRSVSGTYASEAVCEAKHVAPVPAHVGDVEAAGVGVASMTAALALFEHARVQPGEVVLIHGGSGGVGLACVQLARAFGCAVLASAGSERGMEAVTQAGAHVAVSHADPAYVEKLLAGRSHAGIDVIIEMLANVNLPADTRLIAPRGRIVVVGNRGEVMFNPRSLMAKDATVTGMSVMNATDAAATRSMWRVNAALDRGTLRPVVEHVYALEDAPAAHEKVMERGKVGKVVLRVRE
jgi:NADPH2:quinone reductase